MKNLRVVLSIVLVALLTAQSVLASYASDTPLPGVTAAGHLGRPTLEEIIKLPSWEIATVAENFSFDPLVIRRKTAAVEKQSKEREETFKRQAKSAGKQIEAKERELESLPAKAQDEDIGEKRKAIQCEIAQIKRGMTDAAFEYLQGQIAADVDISKLNLLSQWPSAHHELERKISSGTTGQREYGNVLDIGNRSSRKPFRGQADDVRWGEREIEAARQRGIFPKEVNDPVLTEYVNRLAQNIARHSDLQVPPRVFLVQQELRKDGRLVPDKDGRPQHVANAMALPGGSLVVYSGLILETENESELAGVVAHELAHAAARHGHQLANKGKWFNIAQLATSIGLQVLAPGLFQAGSYLAYQLKGLLLQGIFQGLGLVFTIDALGVSREFELEADQLGMQYAWKAGYDPRGFIDLFDRMSRKEGHASRTSFFATHPAFGDRILNALKEHRILQSMTPEREYVTDTSEFQEIKERMRSIVRKSQEREKGVSPRPSLLDAEPQDCRGILASPVLSPATAQRT